MSDMKHAGFFEPVVTRKMLVQPISLVFLMPFFLAFLSTAPLLLSLVLYLFLWLLAVADWHVGRLPNLWVGLLLVTGFAVNAGTDTLSISDAFLGALLGGGILLVIGLIYKMIRKRQGLGMGDVKFMAACGAWLGWMLLPAVLFVSSLSALLFVLMKAIHARRLEMQIRLPFGPFLCLAMWCVWLFLLNQSL